MRVSAAFLSFVFLAGCVTGGSALDRSTAASLQHVHIAPLEAPPLSGQGISKATLPGSVLVFGSTMLGSPSLLIVGGVMMLAELPEANRRSATASKDIETLLNRAGNWEPTLVIAAETERQLTAISNIPVSIETHARRLADIGDRDATFFMENWLAPLRSWYNADRSTFDYAGRSSSDAVLEVGLLNYELAPGYFLVQVVMKLVDPSTGAVLARARSFSNSRVDDMDGLFGNDAESYKRLFESTITPLVSDCIEDLGLRRLRESGTGGSQRGESRIAAPK